MGENEARIAQDWDGDGENRDRIGENEVRIAQDWVGDGENRVRMGENEVRIGEKGLNEKGFNNKGSTAENLTSFSEDFARKTGKGGIGPCSSRPRKKGGK